MATTVDSTDLHTNNCVDEEEHNDKQGNVRQSLNTHRHPHTHTHTHVQGAAKTGLDYYCKSKIYQYTLTRNFAKCWSIFCRTACIA